jgi:ubiquinone/menaquinone biosynthesis C-methylase UbiE
MKQDGVSATTQNRAGRNGWFHRLQVQYFAHADAAKFHWQTSDAYLAKTERALIDHLQLTPAERLLEVGCGEGGNLKLLGDCRARPVGVDYSAAKVQWATKHVPWAGFACADATRLPFQADSFDVVLCRDVLHHLEVEDKQKVIAEMFRVCRAGGRVVVIEPNGRNPIIRVQGLIIDAEQDVLKNSLPHLEAFFANRSGKPTVIWAQPFPLGRMLFHYRWGVPRLSPFLAGTVLRLERAIGRLLPRHRSGYIIIIMAKNGAPLPHAPA